MNSYFKISIVVFLFTSALLRAQEVELVATLASPTGQQITLVAFDPNGKAVLGGDVLGYLFFWDIPTGSLTKIFRAHNRKIKELVISPDRKFMVTSGDDGKIIFWDYKTETQISTFDATDNLKLIDFSNDGKFFYATDKGGLFKFSSPHFAKGEAIYQTKTEIADCILVADSQYIYFAHGKVLSRFHLSYGTANSITEPCASSISSIDIAPGKIACVCDNGSVVIFSGAESSGSLSLSSTGKIQSISFSPSGNYLLAVDNEVKAWAVSTRQVAVTLENDNIQSGTAKFSPSGKYIASGRIDGSVKLWKFTAADEPVKLSLYEMHPNLDARKIEIERIVNLPQKTVDIFIWDDKNIDGDSISMNFNGEWVLLNYGLSKTRKKITLELADGDNKLVLYAHNLGNDPPNTAAITYTQGKKERTVTIHSDMEKSGAINFIYKN